MTKRQSVGVSCLAGLKPGATKIHLTFCTSAAASFCSVGEGDIHAGGEDDVILLLSAGRIRDVNVTERVLPSQPLAKFRHGSEVEGRVIFAEVVHVGEEEELLGQGRAG